MTIRSDQHKHGVMADMGPPGQPGFTSPPIQVSEESCIAKLTLVTGTQSVDEQKDLFKRAFTSELGTRFGEIDEMAEDFKKSCHMKGTIQEMGQLETLSYLTKRGEGKTARELSQALKSMDYDNNNQMSFIEYLLFTFKKTPIQLYNSRPEDLLDVDLSMVDGALEREAEVARKKADMALKIEALRMIVAQGGAGTAKAKLELRQLESADPANDVKDEMAAIRARLTAVANLPKVSSPTLREKRRYVEETKEVERRRAEGEQKKAMAEEEGRERLKAKMAMFK